MKVLLIFLIISFASFVSSVSHDPTGSAGCSNKWTSYNGWCWRYCDKNSNYWCYTVKDCTSDPGKCDGQAKCLADCGKIDDANCVRECPPPSVDPIGSAGCEKKLTIYNGWCRRHCKGTSGLWCYTEQNCLSNQGKCNNASMCLANCGNDDDTNCRRYCPGPDIPEPPPASATQGTTTKV